MLPLISTTHVNQYKTYQRSALAVVGSLCLLSLHRRNSFFHRSSIIEDGYGIGSRLGLDQIRQRVHFLQPHPFLFSPLLIIPNVPRRSFQRHSSCFANLSKIKSEVMYVNTLAFSGATSAVALSHFGWRTSSPSKQLAMDTNKTIREHPPNNWLPTRNPNV